MPQANIVDQLKKEILSFTDEVKERKIGEVAEVSDGVIRIYGLSGAKLGELIKVKTSSGTVSAMVLSLEEGSVGAVVLEDYTLIKAGDEVSSTGEVATIGTSEKIMGRVIDPLGNPLDGKGAIKADKFMAIEKVAPGVITRESVKKPLQTGLKVIDALIPIGRGQRELIIGDRGTGKTAIAVDTIINQKQISEKSRPICIYVSIGQKRSKIARLVATLEQYGAMDYSVVISATASDPAPLNYLAPYAGCAIGEYFMSKGRDALIVYDDLSKHAWSYREISLLLKRPPGREAYPGDIFYLHSRLLERAAKLNKEFGGGSLTALPIIETQAGDISAYIPTNVISITDGQIYLESDLFYQGQRPALNAGLSVSRVGGAAQIKAMKKFAGQLKLDLAQYRELAAFTQFGGDLDPNTKAQIERGKRVTELMKQPQLNPMNVEEQVVLLFAVSTGLLDKIPSEKILDAQEKIINQTKAKNSKILEYIKEKGEISPMQEKELSGTIESAVSDLATTVEEKIVESEEKTDNLPKGGSASGRNR